MSGFEVTGVVLAVIPLLLPALVLYKSGLSRASVFFRRRKHVEKLIQALQSNNISGERPTSFISMRWQVAKKSYAISLLTSKDFYLLVKWWASLTPQPVLC